MAGKRRGPAPEPAAVKKAKGNSGRRPIKTQKMEELVEQVGGASGEMVPPDWLNEEGQKVWEYLAPKLSAMRILQRIDTLTFGRYCENFGRWVTLSKMIESEGMTYKPESDHGNYIRPHPAVPMSQRLDRDLQAAEASFALNPADRQRLFAAKAAASVAPDLFNQSDTDNESEPKSSPVGMLN